MKFVLLSAFCVLFVIQDSIALKNSNACSDCKCEFTCNTIHQLELRVAALETNMEAADIKILEWIRQQYQIRDMGNHLTMQEGEIRKTKERLQEYELKVESDLNGLKNELINAQENDKYFSEDLFAIMEYIKPATNRNESIPIQHGSFGSVLRNWKTSIGPTTSTTTPISSTNFGPYPFTGNKKNEKSASYMNETEDSGCRWQYPPGMLFVNVSEAGLQYMGTRPTHAPNGTVLKFGCHGFGYGMAVDPESGEQINSNFSLQCMNGKWKGGNYPQCRETTLAIERIPVTATKISEQFWIEAHKKCNFNEVNISDNDDCAGYFLCLNEEFKYFKCENPLVFNMASGFCESPVNVDCEAQRQNFRKVINDSGETGYVYHHPNIYYEEAQIQLLSSLLPTIEIDPDQRNVADSLMATRIASELVVYPQSSVTLNCMFPLPWHSPNEALAWLVNYSNSSQHGKLLESQMKNEFNRSIQLDSLTENDSGIYTCIGPNGKKNYIELIVQAVTCQPISIGSDNELKITYGSHAKVKSIAMTTRVFFKCPDGYEKPRYDLAICTVYGYWSTDMLGAPLREFDLCKKSKSSGETSENSHGKSDGCLPFNKILNHNVIMIEPSTNKTLYDIGDRISFKCKGSQVLVGPDSFSCIKGGYWTSYVGPRCVSR